jgi:hypothetical protein
VKQEASLLSLEEDGRWPTAVRSADLFCSQPEEKLLSKEPVTHSLIPPAERHVPTTK